MHACSLVPGASELTVSLPAAPSNGAAGSGDCVVFGALCSTCEQAIFKPALPLPPPDSESSESPCSSDSDETLDIWWSSDSCT